VQAVSDCLRKYLVTRMSRLYVSLAVFRRNVEIAGGNQRSRIPRRGISSVAVRASLNINIAYSLVMLRQHF